MGRPTNMELRNGVWYFRKRWPKRYLLSGEKRPDYVKSFLTRTYQDALAKLVIMQTDAELFFQKNSRKNKASSIVPSTIRPQRPIGSAYAVLQPFEAKQLAAQFFQRALAELDANPVSANQMSSMEADDYRNELNEERGLTSLAYNPRDEEPMAALENRILLDHRYRCDWDSEAGKLLREHLRRACLQLLDIEKARFDGDFSDTISDSLFLLQVSNGNGVAEIEQISLAAAIKEYQADVLDVKNSKQALSPKTIDRYNNELKHIQRFFGDEKSLFSIRGKDCELFRSVFSSLPPNFHTKLQSLSLGYTELADKTLQNDEEMLAWATLEKYLSQLDRFMEWAAGRDYVVRNYANKLSPRGKKPQGSIAKLPFEIDELQRNFNRPLYQGCVDDIYGFHKPGNKIIRRARYWLPLIALFSGLRSGEILQLTPSHFRLSPGGNNFIVLTPDMKLKNENAEREIPIHTILEQAGFIDWVGRRDEPTGLIFPEIPADKFGSASSIFSKRFASDLSKLNLGKRRKKLTFHSFRHTFKRALDRVSVPEHDMDELCGWARGAKTSRRYSIGLEADRLKPQIEKVEYDIDVSNLIYHAKLRD